MYSSNRRRLTYSCDILLCFLFFLAVLLIAEKPGAVDAAEGGYSTANSSAAKGGTRHTLAPQRTVSGPPGIPFMKEPDDEYRLTLIDAVRATLALEPSILTQQQNALISKGAAQSQAGQFDSALDLTLDYDHENTPLDEADRLAEGLSSYRTDATSYSVSLRRLLRNGISISPSVQTTRTETIPSSFDPVTSGQVDFLITVPLLKGLGVGATGAQEMAAKNEYQVSLLTLRHTASLAVLKTLQAYWNYLAAKQNLAEYIDTESRARKLVDDIEILVKADQVPAGELQQLYASLDQKTATRIAAEQQLTVARETLGLAIGLPYEYFRYLPAPSESFPKPPQDCVKRAYHSLEELSLVSLEYRADYKASVQTQESDRILIGEALNGLKPQLDLDLQLGYSALDQSSSFDSLFGSLARDVPGASVQVSLRYSFPFLNNSARGLLLQRKATLARDKIQTDNLARTIRSNVAVAVNDLRNSLRELEKSQRAVRAYRLAVENEKAKYSLGMSTLLDITNMEDNLTSSVLSEIAASQNVANAIARVRYETGTLIPAPENDLYTIRIEDLMTVPSNLTGQPKGKG